VTSRRHHTYDIDWAEVAARARAELGDERVTHFSDRLRKAMNVTADTFRPGAFQPGDTEGLRFEQPPPGA
jgi:transposase